MKHFTRTTLVAAALLVLAGCSIGNTAPDQVALHYRAGPFDSRTFVDCTSPGTRNVDDVNDDHFYYPAGQRDYTFSPDSGADSAPLTSTTQDSQEIQVTGTVKFSLNTDCTPFTDHDGKQWPGGRLQMFHELIANKYSAAPTDDGTPMTAGWTTLLRNYVGAAVDRASDNEALKYGWQALYTNTATKAGWERDVLAQVPTVLKGLTGGEDLFTISGIVLQKPGIAPALQAGLTDRQAAELRSQAADVDKQAAASFPNGIAGYQAYQQQQAVNEAIKSGRVQVLPVPQGSGVIVSPH